MNATQEPLTETTREIVVALLAEQLCQPSEAIKPSAVLAELGADSLDDVEIAMALEDEFSIRIADDELPLKTVQDCIDIVDRKLLALATPKRHGVPA